MIEKAKDEISVPANLGKVNQFSVLTGLHISMQKHNTLTGGEKTAIIPIKQIGLIYETRRRDVNNGKKFEPRALLPMSALPVPCRNFQFVKERVSSCVK